MRVEELIWAATTTRADDGGGGVDVGVTEPTVRCRGKR